MKTINIKFINFWPGFDNDFWFDCWKKQYKHDKIHWINDNNIVPNLLVTSVFGSINDIKQYKCKKILYTRENLNHTHYKNYINNKNLFDLIIGFNDKDNEIDIPWFYDLMYQLNIDINAINIDTTSYRKNLCLINNNPHFLRLKLLSSFNDKNYIVDCPGLVGNNMKNIKISIGQSKIDFLKQYYFYICPENSYADGYITERLFECCISGAIPIYYGCEQLNYGFFNSNRILYIKKDLSNYDEIIDQTIYLLTHKNNLIEFMKQKIFSIESNKIIQNIREKIKITLNQLMENI